MRCAAPCRVPCPHIPCTPHTSPRTPPQPPTATTPHNPPQPLTPPRNPSQVQSVVSMVPMVAMYLAMLADVTLSIFANLRILKAQLMALRSFGIDPRTTPAHRKYQMFVRLALFTFLYVLLEMLIHLSFTGRSDESFALFVLLHQLMELFIAVGIGYTFRAQPFNVHFQQIQQVVA